MPYITWKRGLTEISTPEAAASVGRNVLRLEDVRESANYTCVASSKLGNIEAHTQVVVKSLPRPPTNARVSDITPTSVRLAWSYDIGSENIIYFVIQYKPKKANQEFSEISGITTYFYIVGGMVRVLHFLLISAAFFLLLIETRILFRFSTVTILSCCNMQTPYTEYEFFVIAVNAIGRGSPSAPVYVTTGETSESHA